MDVDRLPTEARLLLAATRDPVWDPERVSALVAEGVDWPLLRLLTVQERLLTVLQSRLEEAGVPVPEIHAEALRRQAAVQEFHLGFTEQVLAQVVAKAADLDVELVVLKGAALALTVYPGFSARPMGDLDVLVRPDRAARLWQALREAGWTLELEGAESFYDAHHHLPPLVGPGSGVVLEIHRSLVSERGPFRIDPDLVWARTRTIAMERGAVRVPDPELQLLHLALHFAWSHACGRGVVRAVRDVTAQVAADPPDWSQLTREARAVGAGPAVYWTLRLAASLSHAPVPPEIVAAVAPSRPAWLLDLLERAYVEEGLFRSCPFPRLSQTLWTLGMDPRRAGWGDHRPWNSDEDFRAVADDANTLVDAPTAASAGGRIARLPAALGYLRRAATGSLGGVRVDGAR